MLRVTDEVYAFADRLAERPGAIANDAAARLQSLHAGPARPFMMRMFDATDQHAAM